MEHSFDIDFAQEYGIECAIIIRHLYFWIQKNEANDVHFHDGCYWSYNSINAFTKIFPYMSKKKIENSLKKLEENGIIKSGCYNKSQYDRTKWYAFTEKGKSIYPKGEMETPKRGNGITQKGEPIPDIYTDSNNTYINTDIYMLEWNKLEEFGLCGIVSIKKDSARYRSLNARVQEYGEEKVLEVIRSIKDSDFLLGKKTKWKASFDWVMKPSNFLKILEGNYFEKKTTYYQQNADLFKGIL